MKNFPEENIILNVPNKLRPRVMRELGLQLEWDKAIDNLTYQKSFIPSQCFVLLCRFYRKLRPQKLGNRCCFEPSCSRYSEICFKIFGVQKGISLTLSRLKRCNASNGGLDLPPGVSDIESMINRILK